jgi:hypothetical protein
VNVSQALNIDFIHVRWKHDSQHADSTIVYGWGNLFPPHVTGAQKLKSHHVRCTCHLAYPPLDSGKAGHCCQVDIRHLGQAGWLYAGFSCWQEPAGRFECTSTYSCCYVTCAAHTHKRARCVIYKLLIVCDPKRATLLDPFETWA